MVVKEARPKGTVGGTRCVDIRYSPCKGGRKETLIEFIRVSGPFDDAMRAAQILWEGMSRDKQFLMLDKKPG